MANADASSSEPLNFSGHDLTGRDFTGQILDRADFTGCDLRGAVFFDARLRNAIFTDARSLDAAQFGGADLTGASFPDGYEFPGVEHAGNVVQSARSVFVLMVLGCVVAWLTVANVSDGALIANATTSSLPLIDSQIPIARFFMFAPVILLLLYAYFAVHMQRAWEEITLLPAIFPDGRSVIRRLPYWLPVGFARLYFLHLKTRRPPMIYLQIGAVVTAVWLLQPFTIVLFGARYLITREVEGLIILLTLFFLCSLLCACSYALTRRTLSGEFRHLIRPVPPSDRPAPARRAVFSTYGHGLIIALIPTAAFAAGTWDYLNDHGVTRQLEGSRLMRAIGFRYTATIRNANLSHSQLNLSGHDLFDARFLDSEFSNADFSGTDLSRAYFLRSRLDDVRFDGTTLEDIYVNGTSFRNSSFILNRGAEVEQNRKPPPPKGIAGEFLNACMYRTYWTGRLSGAVFFNNSFRDAVFQRTKLQKVFFTSSDLRGASFRGSSFDTVYFTDSNLRRTVFESMDGFDPERTAITLVDSSVRDAYFRDLKGTVVIKQTDAGNAVFEGDFTGLRIQGADLRGADFGAAKGLEPATFDDVCIDEHTRFPDNFPKPPPHCGRWTGGLATDPAQTTRVEATDGVCESEWIERNIVGDIEHGSAALEISECYACHAGNPEAIGPPLQGITTRLSGRHQQFDSNRYSPTIKAMAIPWDRQTLDLYLRSPERLVPGNRMRIVGIRDLATRENVLNALLPSPELRPN